MDDAIEKVGNRTILSRRKQKSKLLMVIVAPPPTLCSIILFTDDNITLLYKRCFSFKMTKWLCTLAVNQY